MSCTFSACGIYDPGDEKTTNAIFGVWIFRGAGMAQHGSIWAECLAHSAHTGFMNRGIKTKRMSGFGLWIFRGAAMAQHGSKWPPFCL